MMNPVVHVFAQASSGAELAAQQAQLAQMRAQLAQQQAQMARDQAQMIRDVTRAANDAARQQVRQVITVPPAPFRGLSRRQEGLAFAGFLVVTMACVAVFYPIMRALGKRLEGSAAPRDPLLAKASTERLERIEQAVEAMAIEIERISEGQRFTTKLLSERMPLTLPAER